MKQKEQMMTIPLRSKTDIKMACPDKANEIKHNENELILNMGISKDVKRYKTNSQLLFTGKKRPLHCNAAESQ